MPTFRNLEKAMNPKILIVYPHKNPSPRILTTGKVQQKHPHMRNERLEYCCLPTSATCSDMAERFAGREFTDIFFFGGYYSPELIKYSRVYVRTPVVGFCPKCHGDSVGTNEATKGSNEASRGHISLKSHCPIAVCARANQHFWPSGVKIVNLQVKFVTCNPIIDLFQTISSIITM